MMPMNSGKMTDGKIVRKETGAGGLAGWPEGVDSDGNAQAFQRRFIVGEEGDRVFTPPSAPPRQAAQQ